MRWGEVRVGRGWNGGRGWVFGVEEEEEEEKEEEGGHLAHPSQVCGLLYISNARVALIRFT
jgi:hypothetical protein